MGNLIKKNITNLILGLMVICAVIGVVWSVVTIMLSGELSWE
jgi:hypothetical protein